MSTKRKAAWIAPSFDDFGVNAGDNQKRGNQKRRTHKEVIDLIDVNNDGKKDDSIPWVDKYKPTCEEELAIHKKKIQEVKSWLETKTTTGQILLLTGPAGSGKSAVVHTLTNTPRYTLKEWINPLMQEYDRENRQDATARQESQSQLFHDFLLRANRYTQLNLFAKDEVDFDDGNIEDDSKKIVLVEDMPNFLLYDPTKMHNILRQYKNHGKCPLVFIMSDSNTDNFVNSLFPKKLINELNITNINFNPVAQTGMTKTMLKISTAESKENADLVIPSKDVLSLLATSSNGDIRACINSLQFYCTDRNSIPKLRKKQPIAKGKKTSSSSTKKDAQKIAGCIGEKDASLFLFRALGKVLYCKREDEYEDSEKSLPSHLTRSKRKKLIEIPEEIYENTQISSDNYALYLHQNYPEFFTNIDEVVTVSSNCSQADHIGNSWENKHLQDYSASICARGMMYANTRPSSAGGQSGGWRPLHKPQWFDVFKTSNRNRKFVLDNFNGCHYSKQTLFTDIIPYIEKLRSHGANGLIREISSFPLQRSQQQHTRKNLQALSNDRSDVFADATDSIEHYLTMASMRKKGDFHEFDDVSMNDVIDDVIEDFDDDF